MTALLIAYTSVFSPLPAIYLGLKGRSMLSKSALLILLYVLLSFTADILLMMSGWYGLNNLPVAQAFGLISGVILILFFKELFSDKSKIIYAILVAFIVFYVSDSLFITGIFKANAYAQTLQNFIVIAFSFAYFYRIYMNETDIFIEKSPDFIFVLGCLFYSAGAFFSWLLSTEILSGLNPRDNFYGNWILHNIANISKNLIWALGLWRAQKI